jgi:PAS domain S-box-containing protein
VDQDPLSVLLIEDNPGDARLIREMLSAGVGAEFRLEHADLLATGLEQVARCGADVILLDLSLPDAQGLDTLLRLQREAPGVPVVVLTGLADESVAVQAVQAGAQDYLFKGQVSADLLVRSMRYAIERKRAEEQRVHLLERERAARADAEAERARFRTILDAAPNGIIFVDAATDRVLANPRAAELFGRPFAPEQGRSQYLGQISWPDGRPLSADELLSTRAMSGETIPEQEILIIQPDGTRIPVLGSAAPVKDGSGKVTGAVIVFQDITAHKELERIREEWTSAIAHDLRQPVAAISAYANLLEVLAEQHATSPQEQAGARHILASSRQLYRMIGDLQDVSGLGAGQLQLELQAVDFPALVEEILERMADTLRGHSVRIKVRGKIPQLVIDPGRFEQAFSNLLSNAAKYSYAETQILVEVQDRGLEVELAVTNEGKGISADDMPRLFTRFFRARQAQASGVRGLGLGLYITKEIVRAHGGRIWAESTPDVGATFRLTLPLV